MREPTTKMLLLTPDAIPLARADREAIERAEDEHRQQCIDAGIDLLLIKPIDLSDLETLLLLEHELVNRRHSLRADSDQKRCHEAAVSLC